jgi:tRNA(fMet)-specific endonuclease VapC
VLEGIDIIPLERPADEAYVRLRPELEGGPNNMLIAAHALAVGVPLVAANDCEFRRVKGLLVENWLLRSGA